AVPASKAHALVRESFAGMARSHKQPAGGAFRRSWLCLRARLMLWRGIFRGHGPLVWRWGRNLSGAEGQSPLLQARRWETSPAHALTTSADKESIGLSSRSYRQYRQACVIVSPDR